MEGVEWVELGVAQEAVTGYSRGEWEAEEYSVHEMVFALVEGEEVAGWQSSEVSSRVWLCEAAYTPAIVFVAVSALQQLCLFFLVERGG